MTIKKISAREAEIIAKKIGIQIDGDGITFYATNNEENAIFAFDTKRERDDFIKKHNN